MPFSLAIYNGPKPEVACEYATVSGVSPLPPACVELPAEATGLAGALAAGLAEALPALAAAGADGFAEGALLELAETAAGALDGPAVPPQLDSRTRAATVPPSFDRR
jgi:hypothetical protein